MRCGGLCPPHVVISRCCVCSQAKSLTCECTRLLQATRHSRFGSIARDSVASQTRDTLWTATTLTTYVRVLQLCWDTCVSGDWPSHLFPLRTCSHWRAATCADMHLTNVAIQKTAEGYQKKKGCKLTLQKIKMFMASKHGLPVIDRLFADMQVSGHASVTSLVYTHTCLHCRMLSCAPCLLSARRSCRTSTASSCMVTICCLIQMYVRLLWLHARRGA